MRYLCSRHLETIACDAIWAMTLWQDAMDSGFLSQSRGDWTSARSFFGAAFETASIHCQAPAANEVFSINHLSTAGRHLSQVLQQMELWEEAQLSLLTVQTLLLQASLPAKKPQPVSGHPAKDQATPAVAHILSRSQALIDELLEETAPMSLNSGSDPVKQCHRQGRTHRPTERTDTALAPDIDILLASTFYLMTRHALNANEDLSRAVSDHLEKIFQQAEGHSPRLRATCQRLSLQWSGMQKRRHNHKHHIPTIGPFKCH